MAFKFRSPMHRSVAAATIVSTGLLLFIACQPDKSLQPRTNRAPIAASGGPYQGEEGALFNFDARSSRDPDGDTLTYAWDFGDGDRGTGGVAGHVYRNNGSYQALLIVADPHGASDTVGTQVSVANAAPVITMLTTPSTPLAIGTAATIHVLFSDPGVLDSLTAQVDWGDETSFPITNGSATHTYATAGSHFVTITVRDNDGAVATRTSRAIVVRDPPVNHPPVARIQGPSTTREGAAAFFSARESTDPDGDPLRYFWRFVGFPSYGGGTDSIVEQGHSYYDDGVYTIQLIVIDSAGAQDTASTTLTVMNTAPLVSVFPPMQQAVGIPERARFAISDSGSQDTHTMEIRWGDGTRDSIVPGSEPWNVTMTHTFATPGSYVVEATVRDKDGGVGLGTAAYPVFVFDATKHQVIAGYDASDLGTLGGNSARPNDFNDRGQIVGASRTDAGATHAFLWEDGVLRDLGALGRPNSEAQRISAAGLIAGLVWSGDRYDERASAATIWSGGNGRTVEPTWSFTTGAVAVGASGDIVWNHYGYESTYGYLWRNEVWEPLSTGFNGYPGEWHVVAMNEQGQIVGRKPTHSWGESRIFHASLWEADSLRDLGVLGEFGGCDFDDCSWASPTDINESGQVVGTTSDSLGKAHFVLWENGAIRDLGLAPSVSYEPNRVFINDRGQMAATSGGQAFFWRNGGWQSLGTLGGSTHVVAMNEAGVVVGTSMTNGQQHVFIWSEDRGMVDLGTGPHGFTAAWPVGINARGDIIGLTAPCRLDYYSQCTYPYNDSRAILWRKQ